MKSTQTDELQIKRASDAAMASLLNLTILPVVGFVALLLIYRKTDPDTIGRYHATLGVKQHVMGESV